MFVSAFKRVNVKFCTRFISSTRTDPWKPWEDELIRNYVKINGKKWNDIVRHCLPNRTIQQCQSRWTDTLNPAIKQGPFSTEEKELLEEGVRSLGKGNWTAISQSFLPQRSARRIANEWSSRSSTTNKWTAQEDQLLLQGIEKFGYSSWAKIASELLPWRTRVQIRNHYRSNLDPSVKKDKWTEQELDVLLRRTIVFGVDWHKVAEGIRGRTPEQCSTVWMNELDPALNKGPWSDEETRLFWEKLVEANGHFVKVELPGRNRLSCFRKFWATVRDDREFVLLYGDQQLKKEKSENTPAWRVRVAKLVCEYLQRDTTIRQSPSNKSLHIHTSGPWKQEDLDKLEKLVQDKDNLTREDWKRISKQFVGRDAQQCKYQYEEHLLIKDLNKGTWTKEEDELLSSLIEKHGTHNWDLIHIPNRNKRQCAYRWHRVLQFTPTTIDRGRLTHEEKTLVREGVQMFGNSWKAIQMTYLPNRTPYQIMRWWNTHQPRQPWSDEEDKALLFAVRKYKNEKNQVPSWVDVAKLVEGRSPQQCKVRWSYSLNPDNTKGAWSYEEQMQLFELVQKHKLKAVPGQSIWPLVAKELGTGRSDWACRSKFNYMKKTNHRFF